MELRMMETFDQAARRGAGLPAILSVDAQARLDAAVREPVPPAPPLRARRSFAIGSFDRASRSVPVVMSTQAPTLGEPDPATGEQAYDSLISWDLERFERSPVVLYGHGCDPTFGSFPIGLLRELEWDDEQGLKGRVYFASAAANPLSEQIVAAVDEGILRAVSVGFEPGPVVGTKTAADGKRINIRRDNVLLELSFVPVGADEMAGTPALNPEAAGLPGLAAPGGDQPEAPARPISPAARSALRGHGSTLASAKKPPDDADDEWYARVSEAAAQLAKHRRSRAQLRTDAAEQWAAMARRNEVLRMDVNRLGRVRRHPTTGQVRVDARLTRVGVLEYRNPDGSVRRELRLPEEVFKADSLSTLDDVSVIDIRDHTGMVTPDTWKRAALGHVRSPKRDGQFIVAELVISDRATMDAIDRGERLDISCGYKCRLDKAEPGARWNGIPYDYVQRNIIYNHAALCPPNRGRAGSEVGLRFDSVTALPWGVANLEGDETMNTVMIRMDGKDYAKGSDEHIAKIEADAKARLDAKDAELADAKKKADQEQARADALAEEKAERAKKDEEAAAQKEKDAADQKKKDEDEDEVEHAIRLARRRLERAVLRWRSVKQAKRAKSALQAQARGEKPMGDDEDDDDDKFDAKLDTLSDRELREYVLKAENAKFDATDKSDAYVEARFDGLMETLSPARLAEVDKGKNTLGKVVESAKKGEQELKERVDAVQTGDTVSDAKKKHNDRMANAWKAPPSEDKNGGK